MFGKYRVLSTLGTGNSSTVYLAEHIRLNVYRAIKCIPKDTSLVSSPSSEATLLKNLNHPGIPIIYDIEEDEHFFYIIEEFIQGQSIDTFVSYQKISHELLIKFCIQLCDILDYLHHLMPYPILYQDLKTACPSVSHLTIKNISVFGSKPGIGTTHIAIALASTLTANGYPAVYTERNGNNHLRSMLQEHPAVKEQNGICYCKYFRGIPDYGQWIEPPDSGDAIYVKDFGVYQKDIIELGPENFNLFILSGSPWDLAQTISTGLELSRLGNTAFICNYNNQSSAKKLAGKLGCKVYCFPFDGDAFTCTETKTDLFFHVLSFERGKKKFLNFRKRQP